MRSQLGQSLLRGLIAGIELERSFQSANSFAWVRRQSAQPQKRSYLIRVLFQNLAEEGCRLVLLTGASQPDRLVQFARIWFHGFSRRYLVTGIGLF